MAAQNNKKVNGQASGKNHNADDQMRETMMTPGMNPLSEEDDLEAQMAATMAVDGLAASDDDDLEAQMAAAMAVESNEALSDEDDIDSQMASAIMDESDVDSGMLRAISDEDAKSKATPVHDARFQQLAPSDDITSKDNIDRLLDVNLNIAVELGRKDMKIRDILGLGPGKIIELDKLAGEPVDLLVNGKLLAKGEVVVVDENFGVRITELIDPIDRINILR